MILCQFVLPINIAPVADMFYLYYLYRIIDAIKYTIVSHPYSPEFIFIGHEFFTSFRSRVSCQTLDLPNNSTYC